MVALGDRRDFLQVLRKLHFLRKCNLRKTCKREAAEALPLPARDYCSHGDACPAALSETSVWVVGLSGGQSLVAKLPLVTAYVALP